MSDDDATLERAEKREAKARALVNSVKGQRKLLTTINFFVSAKQQPDACSYVESVGRVAFDDIIELRLMFLPEHRNGIAGAIRGLTELQHECGCSSAWQRPTHAPLVESSKKMEPTAINSSIRFKGSVEYLWMQWLTAKNSNVLARLAELAQRADEVGQQALQFLVTCRDVPEVARLLERLRDGLLREATPMGAAVSEYVPTSAIAGLQRHLADDPITRQVVVWVGWLQGELAVSTRAGLHPAGVPTRWDGINVRCIAASAQELVALARARSMSEDP